MNERIKLPAHDHAHDWHEYGVDAHNGHYWYKCARCNMSDWIASYGTQDQLMPSECKPVADIETSGHEPVAWMTLFHCTGRDALKEKNA